MPTPEPGPNPVEVKPKAPPPVAPWLDDNPLLHDFPLMGHMDAEATRRLVFKLKEQAWRDQQRSVGPLGRLWHNLVSALLPHGQ